MTWRRCVNFSVKKKCEKSTTGLGKNELSRSLPRIRTLSEGALRDEIKNGCVGETTLSHVATVIGV